MFLIFITMIAAGLIASSAYVYQAVTLQSQTVSYAIQAEQQEQYARGVLAYMLALLSGHELDGQEVVCDLFNTQQDGFVRGTIRCTKTATGYTLIVQISKAGKSLSAFSAQVKRQVVGGRTLYSCVASPCVAISHF